MVIFVQLNNSARDFSLA